eukprot:gnl/MRDRNA2_/MRDRNA2_39830_c0_seq1.p1 gnl/MRDRNA2_/MRDRNA2_39830_c0~~gnl/MRDRNA2_/MRDRNA2_39830_c0_seq1.p1  ORF type:complete len:215 (+),score=35.07 gnl/MRDRNA2_/MRDRNA2_39830_c0_seq1:70-714(+)
MLDGQHFSACHPARLSMRHSILMTCATFSAVLPVVANIEDGKIVFLTDSDFEKVTQSSSGTMTKDFIIEFVEHDCKICDGLDATWAEMAKDMKQKLVVSEVNCDISPKTCHRFHVHRYPEIVMISEGKTYHYEGNRHKDSLESWALGDFKKERGIKVPPEATLLEEISHAVLDLIHLDHHIIVCSIAIVFFSCCLVVPFILFFCAGGGDKDHED